MGCCLSKGQALYIVRALCCAAAARCCCCSTESGGGLLRRVVSYAPLPLLLLLLLSQQFYVQQDVPRSVSITDAYVLRQKSSLEGCRVRVGGGRACLMLAGCHSHRLLSEHHSLQVHGASTVLHPVKTDNNVHDAAMSACAP